MTEDQPVSLTFHSPPTPVTDVLITTPPTVSSVNHELLVNIPINLPDPPENKIPVMAGTTPEDDPHIRVVNGSPNLETLDQKPVQTSDVIEEV